MKRKSLSTVVFEGLLDQIRSGKLGPGAQLPTEAELCDNFEVSRTVVREAIARLRSEGLVVPRQGKGVFVSEAPLGSFSIPDQDLDALPQTLALLELRLGVEVEVGGALRHPLHRRRGAGDQGGDGACRRRAPGPGFDTGPL